MSEPAADAAYAGSTILQDKIYNTHLGQNDQIERRTRHDASYEGYPKWIGSKFEPDGTVLPFPGNTLICHLSPTSDLYRALITLVNELKQQTFISHYVLLPPTSWHMTVFEGVSDQIREAGSWPSDLGHDVPLQDCTNHFRHKLASFELDCAPPLKMTVAGWEPLLDGIAVKVVPASIEEDIRLRGLRDRLASHLKTRYPGHESYSFHISLAYTLCSLEEKDQRATMAFLEEQQSKLPANFELGAPEFCVFDNMMDFRREFFLK